MPVGNFIAYSLMQDMICSDGIIHARRLRGEGCLGNFVDTCQRGIENFIIKII